MLNINAFDALKNIKIKHANGDQKNNPQSISIQFYRDQEIIAESMNQNPMN